MRRFLLFLPLCVLLLGCEKIDHTGEAEALSQEPTEIATEDLARYIAGTWLEKDTQFTQMTIYQDPYMGWNIEVTSPMTHGAYVFRANMEYDCDLECFVYHDGRFWDLTPDSDDPTAAEPAVTGSQGTISFIVPDGAEAGDTDAICLEWASDRNTIPVTIFEHSESAN